MREYIWNYASGFHLELKSCFPGYVGGFQIRKNNQLNCAFARKQYQTREFSLIHLCLFY